MHVIPSFGGSEMKKPMVIAISAVSGGGKTTVTKALKKELGNCNVLHFDNYELPGSPSDICKWIDGGADYNEWKLGPFIADVQSLLIKSLHYIVLDYPFAYLNEEMRKYIDLTIYIDTPLDIAMARRLIRDFSICSIEDVREDMNIYLNHGRAAYVEMIQSVKPNSDIVVDGTLSVKEIVERVLSSIKERNKKEDSK